MYQLCRQLVEYMSICIHMKTVMCLSGLTLRTFLLNRQSRGTQLEHNLVIQAAKDSVSLPKTLDVIIQMTMNGMSVT